MYCDASESKKTSRPAKSSMCPMLTKPAAKKATIGKELALDIEMNASLNTVISPVVATTPRMPAYNGYCRRTPPMTVEAFLISHARATGESTSKRMIASIEQFTMSKVNTKPKRMKCPTKKALGGRPSLVVT